MYWFILPTILTVALFYSTGRVHHYVPVLVLSYITGAPVLMWCIINYLSLE